MARLIQEWATRFSRRDRVGTTIVLYGPSGIGKTMAMSFVRQWAAGVANKLLFSGKWPRVPSIEYLYWPRKCHQWESTREPTRELEDILSADVLFIDDIGAESDRYKSGQSTVMLGDIIGARERKYNFITTNIRREDWESRFEMRLADRLTRNEAVHVDLTNILPFNC